MHLNFDKFEPEINAATSTFPDFNSVMDSEIKSSEIHLS